jgi:hypothetical protein
VSNSDRQGLLQRGDPVTAAGYEPPRIEVLGTVEELTMGEFGPASDGAMVGSQSDRRLKVAIAPVDTSAVLAGVLEMRPAHSKRPQPWIPSDRR